MFCGAEGEGQQTRKARRNEAAGDEPDKTQRWDFRRAAERVQQERKRKERKAEGVVDGMGWDGQQVTGHRKRNQKSSCA